MVAVAGHHAGDCSPLGGEGLVQGSLGWAPPMGLARNLAGDQGYGSGDGRHGLFNAETVQQGTAARVNRSGERPWKTAYAKISAAATKISEIGQEPGTTTGRWGSARRCGLSPLWITAVDKCSIRSATPARALCRPGALWGHE
jgi:hypothetical protein